MFLLLPQTRVRHDVYAGVKLGYRSRQHRHTAPIMPDCLGCDGRDTSQCRQLGGVRRAGVTRLTEKS